MPTCEERVRHFPVIFNVQAEVLHSSSLSIGFKQIKPLCFENERSGIGLYFTFFYFFSVGFISQIREEEIQSS